MGKTILVSALCFWGIRCAALSPIGLTCEYRVEPACIDAVPPRLSWILTDTCRGACQTAYRVLVASSEEKLKADEGDLWDSGQVVSDETVGIAYAGRRLSSRQSCWWKVRVWGRDGVESGWSPSSRWAMGLLDRSDWQAKWVSPSPVEPVTAPHFGYRSLKAGSGETVKWVQIDLGSRRTVDSVRLWGAWPVDGSRFPGDGFPLRFRIDFSDEPTFSASETAADLTGSDLPNPEKKPVRVPCVAAKTRYVRLTATRLCGERTVQWD